MLGKAEYYLWMCYKDSLVCDLFENPLAMYLSSIQESFDQANLIAACDLGMLCVV